MMSSFFYNIHLIIKDNRKFIANLTALYFLCRKETNGKYERKTSTTRI